MHEIFLCLMQYESSLDRSSWRRRLKLLEASVVFPSYFKADALYEKLVPVLFTTMKHGAIPEKVAAANSLMKIIRCIPLAARRADIVSRLKKEFGSSKSYWDRMQFIDICVSFLMSFSRRWYKRHIFVSSLQLTQDPVSNVRRRSCALLAPLKAMIRLPADTVLLENLNKCLAYLKADNDRDVVEAAQRASIDLTRIEVPNDSAPNNGSGSHITSGGGSGGAGSGMALLTMHRNATAATAASLSSNLFNVSDDVSNRQKEEEEDALLKLEEEEKSKSVFAPSRGAAGGLLNRSVTTGSGSTASGGVSGIGKSIGLGSGSGGSSAAAAALHALGKSNASAGGGTYKPGGGSTSTTTHPTLPNGKAPPPIVKRGSVSSTTSGAAAASNPSGALKSFNEKTTLSNGMGMTATTIRVKNPPPSSATANTNHLSNSASADSLNGSGSGSMHGTASGGGTKAGGSGNSAGGGGGGSSSGNSASGSSDAPFSFTFANRAAPAARKPKPKLLTSASAASATSPALTAAGALAGGGSSISPSNGTGIGTNGNGSIGSAPSKVRSVSARNGSVTGASGSSAAPTSGGSSISDLLPNKMRAPGSLHTTATSAAGKPSDAPYLFGGSSGGGPSPSSILSASPSWMSSPLFAGAAAAAGTGSGSGSGAGAGGGGGTSNSAARKAATAAASAHSTAIGAGTGAVPLSSLTGGVTPLHPSRRPSSAGKSGPLAPGATSSSIPPIATANASHSTTTSTGGSGSGNTLAVGKGRRSPRAPSPAASAAAALIGLPVSAPPIASSAHIITPHSTHGLGSHTGHTGSGGGGHGIDSLSAALTGANKPKLLGHYTSFPNRPSAGGGGGVGNSFVAGTSDSSHLHAALSTGGGSGSDPSRSRRVVKK